MLGKLRYLIGHGKAAASYPYSGRFIFWLKLPRAILFELILTVKFYLKGRGQNES